MDDEGYMGGPPTKYLPAEEVAPVEEAIPAGDTNNDGAAGNIYPA